MKILYIGNFDKNSVGEPEIARAFQSLGHQVTRLEEQTCDIKKVEMKLREEYDMLLFAKLRIGSDVEVNNLIRNCQVPTVCWLFDLYWGYQREEQIVKHLNPIFKADVVFTTDGGNDDKWKKHNINHFTLRQGIAEGVQPGEVMKKDVGDIGFVGTALTWAGWTYRLELLNFLEKTYGHRFNHVGENGKVRHKALNDYLASWKIVIGDSVHSPYYWSNRLYEMIGRGGFLIHPMIEGLDKEFIPYKHFIPYRYGDWKGLEEKINYYLKADTEREKIRFSGYNHCHKNHTYTHRVKDMIKILKQKGIWK